jgi:hypothetical protein
VQLQSLADWQQIGLSACGHSSRPEERESHEQYPLDTWQPTRLAPVAAAVHDATVDSSVGSQVFPFA